MKLLLAALLLSTSAFAATTTTTTTPTTTTTATTPEKVRFEVFTTNDASTQVTQALQLLVLEKSQPELFTVDAVFYAHKKEKFADNTFWRTAYVAEYQRDRLADWLQCAQFDPETHTCAKVLGLDLNLKGQRKDLQKRLHSNFETAQTRKVNFRNQVFVNGQSYQRPLVYGQLVNDVNPLLPKQKRLTKLGTYKTTKLYAVGTTDGLGKRDIALEREFFRWVPNLEIEPVDPNSKQGRKLLKAADANAVPAYIFDRTSRHNVAINKLATAGRIKVLPTDYSIYELRSGATEVKLGSTPTEKTLDLWVMSQCPYGVKAEAALMAAMDQKLLPEGTKIRLRYIASDVKGEWKALHGEPELTENIRQLAIQATWPQKLWAYLKARNTNYQSEDWIEAAKTAGLDPKAVDAKMSLGRKLMAKDIKDGGKLKISGSPTYLWQNTYVLQTEEDFKATVGYNPQEIKTVEAEAGTRKPAAAPAAGGQCGA